MGPSQQPLSIAGRYVLCAEIASGGMATVYHGLLRGAGGFTRTVAIKRLHSAQAKDRDFSAMFRDEARLAARIHNANVVTTLDVAAIDDELLLVLEYIHGEPLSRLVKAARETDDPAIPIDIACAIACGALHGLHAAHEATAEDGSPLDLVHRDVSPQNILVGADGIPRVLDFGVAKAAGRLQNTRDGELKGKLAYMSPEQLQSKPVDRRTDVYALGVVFWEMLTLERLFFGDNDGAIVARMLEHRIDPPSRVSRRVPKDLDAIVLRALSADPTDRYPTAREMALAIEGVVSPASPTNIAAWVKGLAGDVLAERAQKIAEVESLARQLPPDAKSSSSSLASASVLQRPASEPSAIAVSGRATPAPEARRPSERLRSLLLYAALLVAIGSVLVLVFRERTRRNVTTSTNTTSVGAISAPSATPSSIEPSAPPSVTSSPPLPPAPVASTSTGKVVPPRGPPKPVPQKPTTPPTPSRPGQHCDWHNEDGIWVPTCK